MGRKVYTSGLTEVERAAMTGKPREVSRELSGRMTRIAPPSPSQRAKAQLKLAAFARGRGDEAEQREWLRSVLDRLGLSTEVGLVFVRYGEDGSQVRVFVDVDGDLTCQWCRLVTPDFYTRMPEVMAAHLAVHRQSGDIVPAWVDGRLSAMTRGQP